MDNYPSTAPSTDNILFRRRLSTAAASTSTSTIAQTKRPTIKPSPARWTPRSACRIFVYCLLFLFGILVLRKTTHAIAAVKYVKRCASQVSQSALEQSPDFDRLLATVDSIGATPAILLLNQYALNMTFNFLCNTADMVGVHDRLVFVTLDANAHDTLARVWPNIKQFYWPTPCLYQPFSFAEGAYQTIYLLRANIAASLIRHGRSFWMMQQDTFWRKNLFDLHMEDDFEFDALFDQIGDNQNSQRAQWVNGANFFVHANNRTLEFFDSMAQKLNHWYTPDMGIMIHQCHTWKTTKCDYMPHRIAHSWEWMYTAQKNAPYIMQLDCETDGGSKLAQLAKFGFYFTQSDEPQLCNRTAVYLAVDRMNSGTVEVSRARLSWGRFQFKVYWYIVDYLLMTPIIGNLLKPYLPMVGYILMITL